MASVAKMREDLMPTLAIGEDFADTGLDGDPGDRSGEEPDLYDMVPDSETAEEILEDDEPFASNPDAGFRKVYLAARYSRHEELQGVAADLEALGYEVTSRWIHGEHQVDDKGLSAEADAEQRERFCREDLADLNRAFVCVSFTEEPRTTKTRGGRHFEMGYAYASGLRCIVVGPRENVFHCADGVEVYDSWPECLEILQQEAELTGS